MTREQIQQRILELDRQINQELGKTRLPSLNNRFATFPMAPWGSTLLLGGVWFFGNQIPVVTDFRVWFLVLAALSAVFAAYATVRFLMTKLTRKSDKSYGQATDKVRLLQEERQELQRKMKELKG